MNTSKAKQDTQSALDRAATSAEADQARGKSNQFVGKVKEKVGNFIDDDELAAKGTAQRAEGKAQEIKGKVKEKIDDLTDTVKGAAEAIKDKIADARKR
jgi:uncharacterized protein YjbJ (UPF0337 family)